MSHDTYNKELLFTHDLLSSTLQLELSEAADRREQRPLLATLYLRYIRIANRLSDCIDQMVQPQKRQFIRKLLEATLGRILELKCDLVEADINEWTHCGDTLDQLKLTTMDVELKSMNYFREERWEEISNRNSLIQSVLDRLGYREKVVEKPVMTEMEAIAILQRHERARQGRVRVQFMREFRNLKDRSKPALERKTADSADLNLPAAIKIQKIWRGYTERRNVRRRKYREMELIGMIPKGGIQGQIKKPMPASTEKNDFELDQENYQRRKNMQKERFNEYQQQIKECREKLEKHQRGVVLEQLSDQVRSWLFEYKSQTGKIPEYTGSERTTSRLMLSRQGTDSELSKSTQISSKESKSKKDKVKDSKSNATLQEEETQSKAIISTFVPELNLRKDEYNEVWKKREETDKDLLQRHYNDIIYSEQMAEMENELKKVVDEMMRSELQLLQEALDRDRGHKTKRKSSKKSKRGGKKSKKKKEKDLTPDRTTESLCEELVANGIIKQYPKVFLSDFMGERSYYPPVPHNKGTDPPIALGDFRQILQEYCIVPLLTPQLHQTSASHVKSVLLAGPHGSGKHLLVHAICNELGATLFDLTPANIVGKYPGKSGLVMLVHLITKVSRLLQPSVIFMGNAERPFVKKVPKGDRTDPKRLKKDLPKMIKNLSIEDRVIFIGISNSPWESDQKLLQQVYQKMLLLPKPDYTTRYLLWTNFLNKFKAINWQFNTSVISKISDGYTAGSILKTVEEVMTVKRTLQLCIRPLNVLELVNELSKRTPIYREEEEAMKSWWQKAPIVKRRVKAVEALLEEEAEVQAKQASQTKKRK